MEHQAPRSPITVEETGIDRDLLIGLVVKAMHVSGWSNIPDLTRNVMLSRGVVHSLLEDMRELALVEFLGVANNDPNGEMRFALTSKGQSWASDALAQSQYVGPAPVPFSTYCEQAERQSILNERVNREALARSFSDLVLPESLIHRLGPAANSGKSILLYGRPGNGKTCIAEAIGKAFQQTVYLPHCVEVDGQIIKIFDESVHKPVDIQNNPLTDTPDFSLPQAKNLDTRWVHCRRPIVSTGGELTLSMLDLAYNPNAKFYEAPLQLKATGGVFLVDDFGRQQIDPQAILNRWIVPLERGIDYLTLHTGKKFPIPFNELVMFSTNLAPTELADEATLRRLYYKIEIPIPTPEDYVKIFQNMCRHHELHLADDILPFLFEEFYSKEEHPTAGYHPKYLVEQVLAMCEYDDIPARLDKEMLRMACFNLYATH